MNRCPPALPRFLLHMQSSGWRSQCPKHPSQLPVGVCALCLKQRLLEQGAAGGEEEKDPHRDHRIHQEAQQKASANSPEECKSSARSPALCQSIADGLDSSGRSIGSCAHGGPIVPNPEENTQGWLPTNAPQGLDALNPTVEEGICVGSSPITPRSCNPPATLQMDFAGSCSSLTPDNISDSFNSTVQSQRHIRGSPMDKPFPMQRSLSFHGDSTTRRDGGKQAALWGFSALQMRTKTLSSLFNLGPATRIQSHSDHKTCVSLSPLPVSDIASHRTIFTETKQSEHRSSSKWNTLFGGRNRAAQLSWFSSLFRRRRKKSRPKSAQKFSSCEDGTSPWEAPRPSAWEQIGYSSAWDMPRSSWQGATSWASDNDSVYSGLDSFHDSLAKVREDAKLETQLHDDVMVDAYNAPYHVAEDSGEESKSVTPNTNAGAPQAILRTPQSDELRFVKPRVLHLHRDAATQTTPPRRPFEECHGTTAPNKTVKEKSSHEARHGSWSRIWVKTFSNSNWPTTKHKQKSVRESLENAMDADDQSSVISTSSTREGGYNTRCQDKISSHCDGQWESSNSSRYGAWDAYYSSKQRNMHSPSASQKQKRYPPRGTDSGGAGKVRANGPSPLSIENGLLRFYLTPVRSASATRYRPKQYRTNG